MINAKKEIPTSKRRLSLVANVSAFLHKTSEKSKSRPESFYGASLSNIFDPPKITASDESNNRNSSNYGSRMLSKIKYKRDTSSTSLADITNPNRKVSSTMAPKLEIIKISSPDGSDESVYQIGSMKKFSQSLFNLGV